jgi:hypothetical protein
MTVDLEGGQSVGSSPTATVDRHWQNQQQTQAQTQTQSLRAADHRRQPEPASWGELCQSYRGTWGAGSFSTVNDRGAATQQR